MMEDLIRALQIFLKYGDSYSPTHCSHDMLCIACVNPNVVSPEDKVELDKLGFFVSEEHGRFISFRFGSG